MKTKKLIVTFLAALLCLNIDAQQKLTKEQILDMSIEELSELPLEDLMAAVETLGVSSVDELFSMIMNKNVSSASKQEENSFTSPLSTSVITRDEMRTYGVSSVEEALRLIPGMIVAEKLNGIYDVQMRGLNNIPDNNLYLYTENMNILVMIDGRITHNYAVGMPALENIPISIEDIERVEVVRGATSSLYGPNAVQGVINIITQKPDNAPASVSGSVKVGNNVMQGDVALRKKFNNKISLGLTYNIQRRKRFTDKLYITPSKERYVIDEKYITGESGYISNEKLAEGLAAGTIRNVSAGADLTVDEYCHFYAAANADENGVLFNYNGSADGNVSYPDPSLSRRNDGVNGYVTFNPTSDIHFNLTGGYQYSFNNNTQVGQDNVILRGREFSTAYVNLNADIKNLKLLANYYGGCNHYCVGSAGFQMYMKMGSASAEYTIKVGDLAIKPGVGYQKVYLEDHKPETVNYNDGYGDRETSGFWGYYSQGNKSADNDDLSGSLRLDYKHNGLRLIAAGRFDKTSIPDNWNPSWQFAAAYQINDANFIRIDYGRARRSAALVNSSSNYNWHSPSMPNWMQFVGNPEAPLVSIDNFELGYRWKPSAKVLVDAEAFYSISRDYGELKAYSSMLTLPDDKLTNTLGGLITGQVDPTQLNAMLPTLFGSKAYIRYDNMPFKVHQMGLSMNIDWIISPKLIAKINANLQQTKVDKYYQYSQVEMITKQLTKSAEVTTQNIGLLIPEIMGGVQVAANEAAMAVMMNGGTEEEAQLAASKAGMAYVGSFTGYTPVHPYREKFDAMDEAGKNEFLANLLEKHKNGEMVDGNVRPLGLYYAMKYRIEYNKETKEYYFGSSVAEEPQTTDGYKHKAAPSFYGTLGLIYKPIDKLSFSTFAYFMSKRELSTIFGLDKIDPVFTMNLKAGYKPIQNCEIFFEAHDLFNSDKKQSAYTDKIRGVYSFGVNFEF